jgi:NADH-quinone oxidoreductase subunit G
MPKIIIDGETIECRDGIPVLQAALEAGLEVPHYCYHPGLSVVASCRLCLMQMRVPHPETRELVWMAKLVPSCQTPVKEGMEVRFASELVRQNQKHVMEDYLLNHPLDCPVCDKAGECYLQDYTEQYGPATSRMVEDKLKNPKKDVGPHTLLYQDRCVLCSRCVRFTDEIAGTGELKVVSRGSRCEIDAFPGVPLDNPLQGNVVDLCPVGALLDKDFLFKQRIWLLRSTKSVSPADGRGSTIWIDHNEQGIHRIRPRYNEKVNEWWLSDEARFGWKFVHRPDRLRQVRVRRPGPPASGTPGDDGRQAASETAAGQWEPLRWEELPARLRAHLGELAQEDAGAGLAAVLSPMMSCEEAWLLARFVRSVAPHATLALGFVPVAGADSVFPKGFIIKAEKCPNRRGIERIIQGFGGPTLSFPALLSETAEGRFRGAYLVGGYPGAWVLPEWIESLRRRRFLVVHDLFPSPLDALATIQIPAASWAEREGTFMNCDGLLQPFERALAPLEGVKAEGQLFYELAGSPGLFRAAKVRAEIALTCREFGDVFVPKELPRHAH